MTGSHLYNGRKPARVGLRSMPSPLNANEWIDVSRGLFACLVVVAHAFEVSWAIHPGGPWQMPSWLAGVVRSFPGNGIFWVMGFFVISGYCIHLSVMRMDRDGRFAWKEYVLARLTRVLPLYYAALAFTAIAECLVQGGRPEAWPNGLRGPVLVSQVFCVQNFTQTYGSFAPSWSITNELAYYLLYGTLALLVPAPRRRLASTALLGCLAVACAAQATYLFAVRHPVVYSTGMLFGLGVNWSLGAVVAQHSASLLARRWVRIAAACWPLLLIAGIWSHCDRRLPPQGVYVFCGLAFTLMLLRFIEKGEANRAGPAHAPSRRPRAWIHFLALGSYPMYLFHGPILMLVGTAIYRGRLAADWRLTWALLTFVGIAAGLALGPCAEQPLLAWRRRFLRGREERAHAWAAGPSRATV